MSRSLHNCGAPAPETGRRAASLICTMSRRATGVLDTARRAVPPTLLAMLAIGCDRATPVPSEAARPADTPATARRTIAETRPIHGVALNCHHISDLSLYLESVRHIADLGANSLIVVTPMFQDRADSTRMRLVPGKCPTDDQLVGILNRAKSLNLHTTLLPIVLIENPGEDDWRGTISPTDWDRWWQAYDEFIDYYLDIANRTNVDLFSVGSELNTTEHQADRWRRIIEHARENFPGQLTYSANWDRFHNVDFWPSLDAIAVSSYFEVGRQLEADEPPTVVNLAEAWRNEQRRMLEFAERCDRPLILSEVGYPSVPWAAKHPWNYVVEDGAAADHAAQALCWRAFFLAWSDVLANAEAPAAGMYVYAWDPYHHGQRSDTGYGIHGKPAEQVIRSAFRKLDQVMSTGK